MSTQILQAVAGTIFTATIMTVGIRLIVLARRNRALPELLLGISLLVGGTLGAIVEAAGMSGEAMLEPIVAGKLLAVGKAFGIIGASCHIFFIRIVFRPRAAWATALVAVTVATILSTYAAFWAVGTFSNAQMPLPIFGIELAARCVGSIWLVVEASRYYSDMKRRVALGLSEPLVADRFRLWTIAAVAGLVLLATSVPPIIWPHGDAQWLELLIPVFAAAGVTSSVCYLLAFFPPAFYRRHVEKRFGVNAEAEAKVEAP